MKNWSIITAATILLTSAASCQLLLTNTKEDGNGGSDATTTTTGNSGGVPNTTTVSTSADVSPIGVGTTTSSSSGNPATTVTSTHSSASVSVSSSIATTSTGSVNPVDCGGSVGCGNYCTGMRDQCLTQFGTADSCCAICSTFTDKSLMSAKDDSLACRTTKVGSDCDAAAPISDGGCGTTDFDVCQIALDVCNASASACDGSQDFTTACEASLVKVLLKKRQCAAQQKDFDDTDFCTSLKLDAGTYDCDTNPNTNCSG